MKKLLLTVLLLSGCGLASASELQPQYRVWRSTGVITTLNPVMLSSSPILFHMVAGSAAVNGVGLQYFSLMRSTMQDFSAVLTTKAFIPLNSSIVETPGTGVVWDIFMDSITFYTKQGNSNIQILYDYYKYPSKNPQDQ